MVEYDCQLRQLGAGQERHGSRFYLNFLWVINVLYLGWLQKLLLSFQFDIIIQISKLGSLIFKPLKNSFCYKMGSGDFSFPSPSLILLLLFTASFYSILISPQTQISHSFLLVLCSRHGDRVSFSISLLSSTQLQCLVRGSAPKRLVDKMLEVSKAAPERWCYCNAIFLWISERNQGN